MRTLILFFLVIPNVAWAQPAPWDHEEFSERLLSSDDSVRSSALVEAIAISKHINESLILVFEKESKLTQEQYAASMRGEKIANRQSAPFLARLTEAVIRLKDPRTIPSLVGVLGTGATATAPALAAFGSLSLQPLIEAARSSDNVFQMDHAVLALRCMVEANEHGLPPQARSQIADVVGYRFEHQTEIASVGVILMKTIDLAWILGNPDGIQKVNDLATDRSAILSHGVTESNVDGVQKHAQDRLAGVPPRPICVELMRNI